VRDTVWYALGLLGRAGRGDGDRACRALSAILDCQWDAPGAPYHGTFRRATEEPDPPANPVRWRDYDPNWRQFIGTILAMIIDDYGYDLPADLVARMDRAIRLATIGEEQEGRLSERYTNIALMRAPLDCWAGARYGRPQWLARGQEWARTIHRNFMEFGAFDEYNSPTYYGPDLFALGFWREYAHSPEMAGYAAEMEAILWRDIARLYHAGLRNQCGPFARSYGMDMTRYVAILGQAIWMAVGRERAPHPQPGPDMAHASDFMFPPALAAVGVRVPEDALPALRAFPGEHTVVHPLMGGPFREASAWLGEHCMIGAAVTDGARPAGGQLHPVTMHWRLPGGGIGWMRLTSGEHVAARATERTLTVDCSGDATFAFSVPASGALSVDRARWAFPGLALAVDAEAGDLTVRREGGSVTVILSDARRIVLHVEEAGAPPTGQP